MARRAGLTLSEVVVTLAILAFGILAIREDRSGLCASAADAQFRAYWKTEVVEKNGGNPEEDVFRAMTDPNYTSDSTGFAVSTRGGLPAAADTEASYPVVVDPMGWVARGGGDRSWFGNGTTLTNVPRRSLVKTVGAVTGAERARFSLRLCSLMDGLGYDPNGLPRADRELRYNYLWVVQRPVNGNRYAANLTVVVFENRPHLFTSGVEEVIQTVANGVNPDGRTTTVTLQGAPGKLKPGGWVMDATVAGALRQANPYQVVSITPQGGNTILELQTPLRPRSDGQSGSYTGTFVILPGASGAYTRAPLGGGN